MWSGSAMLSSTVVPASRCARRAVFLRPADRRVDRNVGDVDALRHQLPCHALCESRLGLTRHCEGAAQREAFQRRAGVREDDRAFRAVGVGFVLAHQPRGLLTHQERAERRVPKRVERQARVGFGNALAKNPGTRPSMLCTTKRRRPEIAHDILEQQLHGGGFARIARVSAHAVRLLQILQDRFVRVPGGDGDAHAASPRKSGATRADAWSTPDDERNVLHGR